MNPQKHACYVRRGNRGTASEATLHVETKKVLHLIMQTGVGGKPSRLEINLGVGMVEFLMSIISMLPVGILANNERFRQVARMVLAVAPEEAFTAPEDKS
jgi:hypothetical protein